MKYSLASKVNPITDKKDCIVIPVFTKDKKTILNETGKLVDKACSQAIQLILDNGDFSGEAEKTLMLYNLKGIAAPRVLLVGCGEKDKVDIKTTNKISQAVCQVVRSTKVKKAGVYLSDLLPSNTQNITQIIMGFAETLYQLEDYKSIKENGKKTVLSKVCLSSTSSFDGASKQALKNSIAIVQGMELSSNLANYPANICTPKFIAQEATKISKHYDDITLKVLEEKDMEKLGMGAFLSVSKGSDEPGKMVILQYYGANKSQPPVALVGKGVTFDTGGISLKPGMNMDEMKFDMSGAASMLGTLKACAEMKLNINLVVILALAENMPSGRASKPGDIVTSMQGTTIEVLNTDAEGRLVLCDALTYVGKYKPELVIDAATLTGACIVALGHHISAVLTNDDTLAENLLEAGKDINDPVWRLPMNDDYKKQLKSAFADLGNIGGKAAGTITAACFLGEFTKNYKWAHLDIAGTAWSDKDSTGRPVPLLCQFLINHANK